MRMWRRWKRAMKRLPFLLSSCASPFSLLHLSSPSLSTTISCSSVSLPLPSESTQGNKCICPICLDPLYDGKNTERNDKNDNKTKVFTAECSHSFHFTCIASNIRHGNVTCPICRAEWVQLPKELKFPLALSNPQNADPVLRILDHSIATSRVNRRSSLRLIRYNDDDPIDQTDRNLHQPMHPSLQFSLIPVLNPNPNPNYHVLGRYPCMQTRAYLSVRLAPKPGTDLVLVVTCNGPHIRLLKQSMALVVFSLREVDRLSIVTYYSSTATRAFPLRRMSPQGKRLALQVIERTCYTGGASPIEGLQKGLKILDDRTHLNPIARILHLYDGPNSSHSNLGLGDAPFPIHQYRIGFGFDGFVMHEFEGFVSGLLGGVIGDIILRIGESSGLIRLGELRGGEERRVPLDLSEECECIVVGYSYVEEREREESGQVVVGFGEKRERSESDCEERERDRSVTGPRRSCGERWEYLDPFVVRRWAKHLHGYRMRGGREERSLI